MKSLPWQIISFLLAALLTVSVITCSRRSDLSTPQTATTVIPGDQKPQVTYIPKPVPSHVDSVTVRWYPKYRDTGTTRWCYFEVDTNKILQMFAMKLVYERTLQDDSNAFIGVIDTVFMNQLLGGTLVFINRRPVTNNNNTTFPNSGFNPVGLYAGLTVGRSFREFGIGPSMMLLRNNCSYSVAYDAIHKDVFFTFTKRLWKPRKVP